MCLPLLFFEEWKVLRELMSGTKHKRKVTVASHEKAGVAAVGEFLLCCKG